MKKRITAIRRAQENDAQGNSNSSDRELDNAESMIPLSQEPLTPQSSYDFTSRNGVEDTGETSGKYTKEHDLSGPSSPAEEPRGGYTPTVENSSTKVGSL